MRTLLWEFVFITSANVIPYLNSTGNETRPKNLFAFATLVVV